MLTWQQELDKEKTDPYIYHSFEVGKDTIILLRKTIGIELSTDGGNTWTWLAKKIWRFDEITVDDKGTWWGLERWKGIHEASYCRMYKSEDLGKTWQGYTFYTNLFFPYHIYSQPHQPLAITNFWDNKIYLLSGNDPQHHWHFYKQLPKKDDFADISVDNYFVDAGMNGENKLYVKRKNGKADTLMHFIKASNIYNIEKTKDTLFVSGPTDNNSSYFATVVNEHQLKEYTVPGVDLEMKKTALNHIYLSCSSGAYLFKRNKLIHIFK